MDIAKKAIEKAENEYEKYRIIQDQKYISSMNEFYNKYLEESRKKLKKEFCVKILIICRKKFYNDKGGFLMKDGKSFSNTFINWLITI